MFFKEIKQIILNLHETTKTNEQTNKNKPNSQSNLEKGEQNRRHMFTDFKQCYKAIPLMVLA